MAGSGKDHKVTPKHGTYAQQIPQDQNCGALLKGVTGIKKPFNCGVNFGTLQPREATEADWRGEKKYSQPASPEGLGVPKDDKCRTLRDSPTHHDLPLHHQPHTDGSQAAAALEAPTPPPHCARAAAPSTR